MLAFAVQRAEQMEPFHAANYRLALAAFCDFFDQDDVVALVEQALRRRQVLDAKGWFDASVRASEPQPLPEGPAQAMAARYAIMKQVRMDKVDLRFVTANVFPGSHLNETLMHWKRLIVHPFVADLRTLSADVRDRLGDGEWVDLLEILGDYLDSEAFAARAFGPRAWTDADDERSQGDDDGPSDPISAAETESEDEITETREFKLPPPGSFDGPPPPASPLASGSVARSAERESAPREPVAPSTPASRQPVLDALDVLERAAEALADPDVELDVLALRLELARTPRVAGQVARRLARLGERDGLGEACAALGALV